MSYTLPPADESSIQGLDFTDKPYHTSHIDPVQRFYENVEQVKAFIKENISVCPLFNNSILPHNHILPTYMLNHYFAELLRPRRKSPVPPRR